LNFSDPSFVSTAFSISYRIEAIWRTLSDDKRQGPERILPMNEVCHRTSYSRPSIYRLMAAGKFPQPLKLGFKIGFRESEIDDWIANLPPAPDLATPD
jgi:prophage regulatory protein